MTPFIGNVRTDKSTGRNRPGCPGPGKRGKTSFLWGDEDVLESGNGGDYTASTLNFVFKRVNVKESELHLTF